MKLKVCGMKYHDNIVQVAALKPDYLGFIFYEHSSRFFDNTIPDLPSTIKKVGVFVDTSLDFIREKIKNHDLNLVQLHGKESPDFCRQLRAKKIEVIKVFSILDTFDFNELKAYESVCDYYLFDTKGRLPGGNGYTFNWNILKEYPSSKPFFLSGGIGLDQIDDLKAFGAIKASSFCHSIDVNSQFELEPALKDLKKLKEFKSQL